MSDAHSPQALPRSVSFVSRRTVESLSGQEWVYLISITDGDPAALAAGWASVLRLNFHDVEPEWAAADQRLMDAQQAASIARLAHEAAAARADILVHCQAGISRSGAVAYALCERWGLPFDGELRECNTHVVGLVRAALLRHEAGDAGASGVA